MGHWVLERGMWNFQATKSFIHTAFLYCFQNRTSGHLRYCLYYLYRELKITI